MASKPLKKRYLEPDFEVYDFSNPSGSTKMVLTINELAPFTDKVLTRNLKNTLILPSDYKRAEIYDAGGKLSHQWFVYYSFRHPDTGKFERIKVFKDINSFKTKSERMERAKFIQAYYNYSLEVRGWSPFKIKEDHSHNIIKCIDRFTEFLDNSKMRHNTVRKYKIELNVFKNWLESQGYDKLAIGQIKKQYIFEFVEHVKKRSKVKSGKTVNHYLNDLRRFFNHYMDNYDDYLERNPAAKITRDMVEVRGNIAFTDQEFEAIRKYLIENDPYEWFVCKVIYYTGLRNEAEALELKCGDFDLIRDEFYVDAWVAKNKIRQSVPIYPEFKELLISMDIESYPKDWYIFGRKDKPGPVRVGTDNFARRFRPVKKHFGMGDEFGLYCFKAKRACDLFDDGASIRDIQTLFRHQTPLVTMAYLKSLGRVERKRELDKGRKI